MAAKNHLQPGVEVGGYRIEVPLGEGGMATVYRAIQMSLNRPVALKVLHQKYSERDDFLARFERESGALAQAQHPNIVSVIDRGAFDGNYYFVMEFVDGSDLDVLLSRYEFTLKQIMQIINEVGKGLSYVHSLEMVHRDMKPANILIGKQGVIKVSDFGIAQIAQGTGGDQGLTDEGAAMGTGVYMAPEQMSDARNVDHRADVYALGATFYKLLTRRLPAGSFAMPSHLRPEVPAKVDGVIRKALDPDRDCRQQTVKQLCREMILALKNRNLDASSASAGIEGQTSAVAISKLHRAEDSAQSSPENEMPSAFRGLKPVVTTDSASGKKKKKKKKKRGAESARKLSRPVGLVLLSWQPCCSYF
jgi:serine/threonine protein kinase